MFTECSGKERYNIELAGKRRNMASGLFSSRSLPKSRRKERAPALCKVTYIAARAREKERSARIVLAMCILVKVHRSCRRCSRLRVRNGTFLPVNHDDLGRRERSGRKGVGIWYLWKIDSSCGVHMSTMRRHHSARASPTRGKYVRERAAPLSY